MRADFAATFREPGRSHTLVYTRREKYLLGGPFLLEGERFLGAIGLMDNFTVAEGQNTKAWTTKPKDEILRSSEALRDRVERDAELLQFDYKFSLAPTKPRPGGGAIGGLRLLEPPFPWECDLRASISAMHPGQLNLTLMEVFENGTGRDLGTIDFRKARPVATDRGLLHVHRVERALPRWSELLSELIEVLSSWSSELVEVRHHQASGPS